MPQRIRKVRKLRGSRSHGWGVRRHKGKGGQGGHGKAGGHKHKWTHTIKYEPKRYGKHGFYRPIIGKTTTINVGELDELANTLLADGHVLKKDEELIINLNELGIYKLLGSGRMKRQLTLLVKSHSQIAAKKIEEAKGKIIKVE